MKNITRTIIVSQVEIFNKKNLVEPVYTTTVYTDDESEAEKNAISEFLLNTFDTDDERKKTKKMVFGVITETTTHKGEMPVDKFVQYCIKNGTFEKIEK